MASRARISSRWALAAALLFWVFAVGGPLLALASRVGSLRDFLAPDVLATVRVSLSQALWSTGLSAALALPLGLWVGSLRGGHWTRVVLALPFGIPSVVAASCWVLWLGRAGILARAGLPLDWLYSLEAVILAHVFFNLPWIALLVARARRGVPLRELEAARTLGAGRVAALRWVVWPRVRGAWGAASVQTFSFCIMSFVLVLLLGGGPPVETLETGIYSRVRTGGLDLSGAAACALWQLGLTVLPWLALTLWNERRGALAVGSPAEGAPFARRSPHGAAAPAVRLEEGLAFGVAAVFVLPYLTLFTSSAVLRLLNPGFLRELLEPLGLSLLLAAATAAGATTLAVLATLGLRSVGRGRAGVSALLAFPSGLSALVLGLGIWLAYGRWLDPFEGSLTAMILLQSALFFPIALRMLWPVAERSPVRDFEAALSLGASSFTAFRVAVWPRWRPTLFAAFAMVAGAALGEVAAVSLFYSERLVPLPLVISRWMAQYRFEDAQAVATLLLALSFLVMGALSLSAEDWIPRADRRAERKPLEGKGLS